jgi:HK97 family phage portal protein
MGLRTKAAAALQSVTTAMGLTDPLLMRWATQGGGPNGEDNPSGETVTVQTALQLDTVFACARLIAQTIATLPVMIYERGQNDQQAKVATRHSLYRVIHDRPNAEMTAVEFWTAIVACKLLWGNGYAAIRRRADGSVIALDPLRTDRVQVTRQTDGSRTYTYTWNGQTTVYFEDDIFHLKGFSLDGEEGISCIAAGWKSFGTAIATERTAGSIFKNMLRPSGYLSIPQFLSKENRLKAREYIKDFIGSGNTGKVPFFEGGWKFEPFSIPPDDAQLLETRAFNIETICRWFGVPPMLVGHTEKTTTWGTGLEQINLGFLQYTLRPHLKEIEQAIGMRLLSERDQARYYAEFNVEGLLRADSKGRADVYDKGIKGGWMTPNEVRALENLPPLPGGDHLMIQGAMMPLEMLIEQAARTAANLALAAQQPAQLALPKPDPTDDFVPAGNAAAEAEAEPAASTD